MEKLRRVVVKEELVALTGDFRKAVALNQMIYWSERVKDFDKFITEEMQRFETKTSDASTIDISTIKPLKGWIYKKAEELSEETMMNVSAKAMRDYLKSLVENGWLDERKNPSMAMDRTYQYRVNLIKIQQDLFELGYSLEGYSFDVSIFVKVNTKLQKVNTSLQNVNRKGDLEHWKGENVNCKGEKVKAIPEIISNTISNTNSVNHSKQNEEKMSGELANNESFERYNKIIANCELYLLQDKRLGYAIEQAIQGMFFDEEFSTETLKIPTVLVRRNLERLNLTIIQFAIDKMRKASEKGVVINSPTKYLQVCIYNAISEYETETLTFNIESAAKNDEDNAFERLVKNTEYEDVFNQIKNEKPIVYETWLKKISEIKKDGQTVILKTKDDFVRGIIEQRYLEDLKAKFISIGINEVHIN